MESWTLVEAVLQAPREYGPWVSISWLTAWPLGCYSCLFTRKRSEARMTVRVSVLVPRGVSFAEAYHALSTFSSTIEVSNIYLVSQPQAIGFRWDAAQRGQFPGSQVYLGTDHQQWAFMDVGGGTQTLWKNWNRLPYDHFLSCLDIRPKLGA